MQTTPGPGVIRRATTAALAISLAGSLAVATDAVAQAPAPAAATPAAPVMSRDWKRLRTPSLTVVGNAGAGELRRVATEIERFRLALGAFAPAMRLDSPLPTTVVVFSDDRAFMPFKPRERGRPMPFVAGYFSPLPEEHRIVMSGTGRREFTFYVIFHEYTHLLVDQNVRRLPLWLHEGLAEFYSTFSGSEQDGRTIIGRPIEWRVATLASSTPLPLARLTSPAALGELLRDPVATDRFYATAWALTHYLMVGEGGGLRPKLLAFLKACESGPGCRRGVQGRVRRGPRAARQARRGARHEAAAVGDPAADDDGRHPARHRADARDGRPADPRRSARCGRARTTRRRRISPARCRSIRSTSAPA